MGGEPAERLESIRARLDPVQSGLIPAHVTLCREDELVAWSADALGARLARASLPPLTMQFGPPESFDGHGVLLPCTDGAAAFHRLRMVVLGAEPVRRPLAHITLAHPRNPRTNENVAATYASLNAPLEITFESVCLIEQVAGQPWEVRATFPLAR